MTAGLSVHSAQGQKVERGGEGDSSSHVNFLIWCVELASIKTGANSSNWVSCEFVITSHQTCSASSSGCRWERGTPGVRAARPCHLRYVPANFRSRCRCRGTRDCLSGTGTGDSPGERAVKQTSCSPHHCHPTYKLQIFEL